MGIGLSRKPVGNRVVHVLVATGGVPVVNKGKRRSGQEREQEEFR